MLIDTHSHLDVAEFDADRDAVIARARSVGIRQQIVPAIEAATWPTLRAVCARAPGLHAAYGLHPVYLQSHRAAHLLDLRQWIEREHPVAVGECGLDYFVDDPDPVAQGHLFDSQLRIARDFDLPVIVHARRAVDAVITAIRRVGGLRGVVHSFPGSLQQATQLSQAGFLLGVGGPVTYERANRLRKLVACMPLEWLLLETDSPDQPDSALRGQRNEPARLTCIADTIASLRGCTPGDIAAVTSANAARLFRLLPPAR